jgi:hypothetical protein
VDFAVALPDFSAASRLSSPEQLAPMTSLAADAWRRERGTGERTRYEMTIS